MFRGCLTVRDKLAVTTIEVGYFTLLCFGCWDNTAWVLWLQGEPVVFVLTVQKERSYNRSFCLDWQIQIYCSVQCGGFYVLDGHCGVVHFSWVVLPMDLDGFSVCVDNLDVFHWCLNMFGWRCRASFSLMARAEWLRNMR